MAIEIHDDYIQFGDTKISQTATGISLGYKKIVVPQILERSPIQSSTISGYTSGGQSLNPAPAGKVTTIDKFPFAADAGATGVGDLTQGRYGPAGQSSTVYGYASGGDINPTFSNVIDKFPFATDADATDVGNLTQARGRMAGQSSSESGYTSGGLISFISPSSFSSNIIDKFTFATDAHATGVGVLSQGRYSTAGQSSEIYGYTSSGVTETEGKVTTIDKFPFAADAGATGVGDLTLARGAPAGQSSTVSGYSSGGGTPPSPSAYSNVIDKFPFATDADATDVGDLTQARFRAAGQSSSESGYTSGGKYDYLFDYSNIIDKFPFASNASATDVGDLTQARSAPAGQQV